MKFARALIPGSSPMGHIGYWAAAVTILAMGAALHGTTRSIEAAGARVDHTVEVMGKIAGVGAGLVRAESGQRGFLLYGEQRFREEREAALGAASKDLADLVELTRDNAAQQQRLVRVNALVGERAALMADNERRRQQGAGISAGSGRGQRLSGQIAASLEEMRDDELRLLGQRREEQRDAYSRSMLILACAVVVVIAVMIPGYIGFVREARGRFRAERLITSLADTAPGALVQYRVYPDGRSRYEFLSGNVGKLRGIDARLALRDPEVVLGTILEEDRAAFLAALAEGGRTLSHVQHDYRVRGPDGVLRWMRTSAAPRRAADGSIVWSAHWSDITDQKTLELDLRNAKEAADAANRAKSTFLATMSHEIRTPMNGVLGMLELLALSGLNDEQRATLEVVRQSGRSLQRIIDDILDFSKIEAGKLELRPEVTCVADIVGRVHNIYSGNASAKGLLLRHAVDRRIHAAVIVDPLRLQQILNNLVSNAIKFTAQGEVEITADLVRADDGNDIVAFTVRDTGVGVSAEEKARLFTPFSQAASAQHSQGGTGLGLSICRRLAHMMGGGIEMESKEGVGTAVVLTLPLPVAQGAHALERRDAARPEVPIAKLRRPAPDIAQAVEEGTLLLLVDDHPINRMVLLKQVNALGYAAETAIDGLDALDHWNTGRYGAVITDCNMPEMSGHELTRHIRACEERNRHARTPIIACTANVLGGEAEKCLAQGMDDYLAKPIDLGQLAEKLDHWVPLPGTMPCVGGAIDGSVLARISAGDRAAELEILARFREFNAGDVIALTMAAERWDLPQLQHIAHRIKGAARTVGALRLADACEALEGACRVGSSRVDLQACKLEYSIVSPK